MGPFLSAFTVILNFNQPKEDTSMPNVIVICSKCEEGKEKPKPMNMPVQSTLGAELLDIINVLRGLGTPEEQVVSAVWEHLRKGTTS